MYIYIAIFALICIGVYYLYRIHGNKLSFLSFMKTTESIDEGYDNGNSVIEENYEDGNDDDYSDDDE
jgi:hypothetical protein